MTESIERQPQYEPRAEPVTEKKVVASTATAAGVVALLTTILSVIESDQLVEGCPDWVSVFIAVAISAGGTFLAGRSAPHTARRDLPVSQR